MSSDNSLTEAPNLNSVATESQASPIDESGSPLGTAAHSDGQTSESPFCDECGSLMLNQRDRLVCTDCGHLADPLGDEWVLVNEQNPPEDPFVPDDIADTLFTTKTQCPRCENDVARTYSMQIRAADESATRFFVCTECDHKWRDDDH